LKRNNPDIDQAFAQMMREHEKAVFALAYGKLRNVHDAEDVAQEVFVEAFRNAHKMQNPEKVSAWLFRTTVYRCKDHFRKTSRRRRRERIYTSTAKSSDEMKFEEETQDILLKVIATLPEKYRIMVMLRHFARLSYAEISKATGLSNTTIDTRLRTAKKKLKKMLLETEEGAGQ
jgi:RNA polymerase sigma-70 factor (ECF subfamily)